MNALKKLFLTELADRYDAEKRLVRAMPKMIKTSTCKHLQKLLQSHLKETEGHVKKLEQVFHLLDQKVTAKKCEATIGLLAEGAEIASEFKRSPALNAALISVAQKVEHYEIASYGALREWATVLGNEPAAALLKEVLVEEKAANSALIALARTRSNTEAHGDKAAMECSGETPSVKLPHVRRNVRPLKIRRTRAGTV